MDGARRAIYTEVVLLARLEDSCENHSRRSPRVWGGLAQTGSNWFAGVICMGDSSDNHHSEIKVFSTSPQSTAVDQGSYVQHVIDVARWSEEAGCQGILVYTDNSLIDPWLVSQIII